VEVVAAASEAALVVVAVAALEEAEVSVIEEAAEAEVAAEVPLIEDVEVHQDSQLLDNKITQNIYEDHHAHEPIFTPQVKSCGE